MFKKIFLIILKKDEISKFDYIFTFIILAFLLLSFQQLDLLHTILSSFAYLKGHILDFYEYNLPIVYVNNYLPSTYILFAIWYIPFKILGFLNNEYRYSSNFTWIVFYGKLLTTLFYLGTGYFIYKISLFVGMGKIKAKICSYAFITMPIAVFSQFMFGQYDIFTTFFMVVGFYFWLKNDLKKFIFIFGIALTFKYLSLIVFLVLLLIKEKKILKLIKSCLLVCIPFLIETLVYIQSAAFRHGVFGFSALDYIKALKFNFGVFQLYVAVFFICIILAACYFKECKDSNEELIVSLFFINLIMFCFFGISMWHHQWVLMAVPFWVISSFLCKKQQIHILFHLMMSVLFIIVGVNIYKTHVDQFMLARGIWRNIFSIKYLDDLTMSNFCKFMDLTLCYTSFSALILCQAIFKSKKYCLSDFKEMEKGTLALIKSVFMIGVFIFVIPAFYCGIKARNLNKQNSIVSLSQTNMNQISKIDNKLIIDNNQDPFIIYALDEVIDGKNANYLLIDFDSDNNRNIIFWYNAGIHIQLYWANEKGNFCEEKSIKYFSIDAKILLSLPDSFKKDNKIKMIRIDIDNSKVGESFKIKKIKLLK